MFITRRGFQVKDKRNKYRRFDVDMYIRSGNKTSNLWMKPPYSSLDTRLCFPGIYLLLIQKVFFKLVLLIVIMKRIVLLSIISKNLLINVGFGNYGTTKFRQCLPRLILLFLFFTIAYAVGL